MSGSQFATIRSNLLHKAFNALYGPLVFLHEPAGKLLAGQAWPVRRRRLLSLTEPAGKTLDLGCGSGILLCSVREQSRCAVGVDPSTAMRRLARRRGCQVLPGSSFCIPLRNDSIERVLISYPGPWIRSPVTWAELERVSCANAEIAILLDGSYTNGSYAWLRRLLFRLAYGPRHDQLKALEDAQLGSAGILGAMHTLVDRWGVAYYWIGRRA